jgi:N-methylhydantoinase B
MVTGVGGGYGDPLSRDPQSVQCDVQNELLTVSDARRLYGVVIIPGSLAVDQAATLAMRQELAAQPRNMDQVT